jgi:hypothetical protein|tara:strand:- start:40 stop:462 length:423 start_codon:yes stop_codon:yes gene_type:complete
MAFSQYLATKVLSWIKNTSFPTALTNVYISLHTADPGTAGTNNDVTASIRGNSTRVAIASGNFSTVGSASGGGFQITNSSVCQITTSAQNSSGATVTNFGIWDAATSGNFLASGSLTTNVDVQLGDTVQFNIGAMAIKVI